MKFCRWCKTRPSLRKDGYCTAKCKRAERHDDWKWHVQHQPQPAKVD